MDNSHNIEAEKAVLGCMMLGSNCPALKAEDFYYGRHKLIFETILQIQDAGGDVDYVTLLDKLRPHGDKFEAVGGLTYVISLPDAIAGLQKNIDRYADLVREAARRRKLKTKAMQITTSKGGMEELEHHVNSFFEEAEKVSGNKKDFTHAPELAKDALKRYEKIANGEKPKLVECGIYAIDRQKLFAPTNLIFLGGSSSMGKTSVAIRISRGAAARGHRILFISLEMTKAQLADKLFSQTGRIDGEKLSETVQPEDFGKISLAFGRIAELPLTIIDRTHCTISDIRMIIQSHLNEHKDLAMVVIDHFHELQLTPGRKSASDVALWAEQASLLKGMANRFQLPILALSQLNGNMNKRMPPIPTTKDLKEAPGAMEHIADSIILCYRQDYYEEKGYFNGNEKKLSDDLRGKLLLITGKNRHGRTWTSTFWWRPEYTDIDEIDGRY